MEMPKIENPHIYELLDDIIQQAVDLVDNMWGSDEEYRSDTPIDDQLFINESMLHLHYALYGEEIDEPGAFTPLPKQMVQYIEWKIRTKLLFKAIGDRIVYRWIK